MTEYNVSLRSFNTFGLDVTAKVLSRIGAMDDLQEVISGNLQKNEPLLILGGGSNMLFTRNVDGLVLKNELSGIAVTHEDADTVTICAGAGVGWHGLVMHCVDHGWGGIENLSLIPGKVGAAPMQNIGAYGVELKDVFHSLEAVHLITGDVRHFTPSECALGYREKRVQTWPQRRIHHYFRKSEAEEATATQYILWRHWSRTGVHGRGFSHSERCEPSSHQYQKEQTARP
jgi:UDP-N-acetylmuramate dehydrogenase